MEDALTILIADQDEADRNSINRALMQGEIVIRSIVMSNSYENAIAELESNVFDCAIFNKELLTELNYVQQIRNYQTALIVLAEQGNQRLAVEIMKAGANDYFLKQDLTPENLSVSILQAVRLQRTERQAQEVMQQLRESEERYRLILEGATDGIWDWYICENQVYCNDRMYEILGVSLAEIGTAQDVFVQLIHPNDQQIVVEAIRSHLTFNTPFEVEFRLRHASGSYRYCTARGSAQRDRQGNLFRMLGVVNDITQCRNDEQRITELNRILEERVIELQTLLDVIPIGIAIAEDSACDVIRVNPYLSVQLDISINQNVSLNSLNRDRIPFKIYQNGRELEPHELPMQRASASGRVISNQEIDVVKSNGETIKFLTEAAPLFDEQGQSRGCIAAYVDITDRKKIEESLRDAVLILARQQQQLEEQNATLIQQNCELENQRERIQFQNLKLTEAAQLKSQFLATMSHELRTPMNAIMGFSQLLLRQKTLTCSQHEMAQRILNNSQNLLTLINDLLDFSKIETGRLQLKLEQFNLSDLLISTITESQSLADQKNLTLRSEFHLENPLIVNDSSRLRQVLVNLISNALKFTDQGEVEVRIWELHSNRIAIAVRDTGIGIAPENLDQIFEAFRQLDQTIARRYPGTGLGLAITRWLVELMHGSIQVESEVNQGSTFRVEIPRSLA